MSFKSDFGIFSAIKRLKKPFLEFLCGYFGLSGGVLAPSDPSLYPQSPHGSYFSFYIDFAERGGTQLISCAST